MISGRRLWCPPVSGRRCCCAVRRRAARAPAFERDTRLAKRQGLTCWSRRSTRQVAGTHGASTPSRPRSASASCATPRRCRSAPDLYARVRQGAVTLSNAMHHLQQAENRKRLESVEAMKAKEVAGIFDVIVVDPPWPKPGAGVDGLPVNYPRLMD